MTSVSAFVSSHYDTEMFDDKEAVYEIDDERLRDDDESIVFHKTSVSRNAVRSYYLFSGKRNSR